VLPSTSYFLVHIGIENINAHHRIGIIPMSLEMTKDFQGKGSGGLSDMILYSLRISLGICRSCNPTPKPEINTNK
jgi:hypothetical protein